MVRKRLPPKRIRDDAFKFLDVIDNMNVLFLGPNASIKKSSIFEAKNVKESTSKPFGSRITKKKSEFDFF